MEELSPSFCPEGADDLEGEMGNVHKKINNITLLHKLQILVEMVLVSSNMAVLQ